MAGQIDRISRALLAFAGRRVKSMVAETASQLAEATPVDTGHAKSNWIPTLDAPVAEVFGSKAAVSTAGRFLGQSEVFASFKAGVTRRVYITNKVPYIQVLNGGSSRQAPKFFVQKAIAHAISREASRTSRRAS